MTRRGSGRLKCLAVASEIFPLIKTGGLADVAGALPGAMAQVGADVRTMVPGYPAVMAALGRRRPAARIGELIGGPATLWQGKAAGLDLLALDAPHLFDRPGNPYLGPDGRDWPDNAERFAALARVAADIGQGLVPAYRPDVIHAHDWQAALVPALLHYRERGGPPVVLTIHNLAFQGRFAPATLSRIGLPDRAFHVDGVEFYGDVGFLKAGILFSHRITTVSPTYAAEICTPEGGMGLDGLLRARADDLVGILNGIDVSVWDPSNDPAIAASFDAERLPARSANKADLQAAFGLDPDPGAPLFGVISRLTSQKGLDLLLTALPRLLAQNGQLALLGTGEPALEAGFEEAAALHPGRIACRIGYDEALSHRIQAGVDALLVPSRFEPCGLTQLCALRYGAVPVVARVGGLADTVIDANPAALGKGVATGVQFPPDSELMMENALVRTATLFRDQAVWTGLQRNGMTSDVSWRKSAAHYLELFRSLA